LHPPPVPILGPNGVLRLKNASKRCATPGVGVLAGDEFMDRFVKRANISHFERLLEHTTDASKREIIFTLLAEEKAEELLHIRPPATSA
jgi:hypothetical protein